MANINNTASNTLLSGTSGNDSIYNGGSDVTINAGAGDDSIENFGDSDVTVDLGAGDDTVYSYGSRVTINAGAGNDYISNTGAKILFQYASGDGNDLIKGFNESSTLKITGGTYSTDFVGDDLIVTVGKGKITLVGAASLESVNINDEKISGYSWTLDGTLATYGTANKTLLTVSGVKSLKGISLDGKVVTVSKAALNATDISVSSGYTLALGSDVSKPSTSKDWSLDGTTAAYQQTTTEGYTLADNAITYTKKSSKTLVTVDGVESLEGLSLSKKVVTVSAAALGTNDVTISDGYKLKLGKDVDAPTSKQAAWTLKNTTATYKSAGTTAGYTLEDNVIRYSKKKSAATLATIKGVENVDGLSVSGKMISAEATALASKVTVSSDEYGFNFGTDYKKAKISGSEFDDKIKSAGQRVTMVGGAGDDSIVGNGKYSSMSGGAGNDTIISNVNGSTLNGGAGNDKLTGSDGEDTFVYAGGNDTITNYDTGDKISLASGAAEISVSLGDVIFKVGSGKFTLKNAADLKVTYIDADGTEHTYPEEQNPVEFNAKGTGVTLTTAYTEDAFDINGYRD